MDGNQRAEPPPNLYAFTSDASLAPYRVPVHELVKSLRDSDPEGLDLILLGAAVFHHEHDNSKSSNDLRILLVQRAPTDTMPLLWETPGGASASTSDNDRGLHEKVYKDEDKSALHGVVRELWEEAGLVAKHIVMRVEPDGMLVTPRGFRVKRLSFWVEVYQDDQVGSTAGDGVVASRGRKDGDPPRVTLDPSEHVAFLWATEDEARVGRCGNVEFTFTTDVQAKAVFDAFKIAKQQKSLI